MATEQGRVARKVQRERWRLLREVHTLLEKPMIVLSIVWVVLLIVDFTRGLGQVLQAISYIIWAAFIVNFLIEIAIAPVKLKYLRHNWLTVISLAIPALRIFSIFRFLRVLRAVRTVHSISLLRLLTSLNRGLRAIRQTLYKRRISYVIATTIIITFVGAAGMEYFEGAPAQTGGAAGSSGLHNFGDSLWWSAMMMTTMGSDYWPKTAEGRIITFLLALYAFAIFGYITATIASHFIGSDRRQSEQQNSEQDSLQKEIIALRAQVERLAQQLELRNERIDMQQSDHEAGTEYRQSRQPGFEPDYHKQGYA